MRHFNDNRHRTRDLLLEYAQSIMPLHPRAGGLSMVYPWGNDNASGEALPPFPNMTAIQSLYPWEMQNLTLFGDWLYQFASNSGYHGSRQEFFNYFGLYLENNQQEIIFANFIDFPDIGEDDKLYFDLDEKILYYWTGTGYTPVNAMLIANTIIEGGGA